MSATPQTTAAGGPSCRPQGSQCIALILQGGGALGAYEAGVYQALEEAELHPDWIVGVSVGAISTALIVGNPPAVRCRATWTGYWGARTTPASPCAAG
ncbi:patatin-like phospholipase family protein [Paeniroseomonas aquatica]|jgi:NTE family protein|uniref:Patatin-like phospholipase family protein n=1 Tax=Paeniroseomonas aquatica TaxID=373043 RepID=A0ABT8A2T8_9PROT|nr:patatin-like phospholipase family protein [Paeniroseomonas aquatica]MDN3563879.1 patatin-like phospholipase family protein [Paeniroseomonas aquatica]